MSITFKIIKLFDHHNRGQFIVARQLDFKAPTIIKDRSLLNGIPVFHYLEMYPFTQEGEEPQFDVYVFRPMETKAYPKHYFHEGQIVELSLDTDSTDASLKEFENEIKKAIPELFKIARSLTWNNLSENYSFIITEVKTSNETLQEQRKANKKVNDQKTPVSFIELMRTVRTLYPYLYDVNLEIYRAKRNITIIDFRYYPKSSLNQDYKQAISNNPPMLHCKIAHPPAFPENEKFDINWQHYENMSGLKRWRLKLKTILKKSYENTRVEIPEKKVENILRNAIENENEKKLALFIAQADKIDDSYYELIEKALLGTWHSQHEELVNTIYLKSLIDDRFVDPILNIALDKEGFRWYDDELESTLRKCVHALKNINSEKSRRALKELENLNNDNVKSALEMYE